MKTVLITGVSSGIGYETARVLIANGCRVFGSVRAQEEAARLVEELGPAFVPMVFDVRDEHAVGRAAEIVRSVLRGERLTALVNNAGVCLPGALLDQPIEDIRAQLDTNLAGPIIVTKAFLPLLGVGSAGSGPLGRVINISSISSRIASPFGTAYCASKSGLEAFSESLRRELMGFGVHVAIVAPGLTRTQIWRKAAKQYKAHAEFSPFALPLGKTVSLLGKTALKHGTEPSVVAETVWKAIVAKNPKVRYAPSRHALLENGLIQSLPRRVMDFVMYYRFHLYKRPGRSATPADAMRNSAGQGQDVVAARIATG